MMDHKMMGSRRGRSRGVEKVRRRKGNLQARAKREQASPAKVKGNRVRLRMAKARLKMANPHRTVSRVKAAHKAKEQAVKASRRAASPPTSRAKRDCEANHNEAARNRVPVNHKGAIKVAKGEAQGAATKDRLRVRISPNGTNACAMSSRW